MLKTKASSEWDSSELTRVWGEIFMLFSFTIGLSSNQRGGEAPLHLGYVSISLALRGGAQPSSSAKTCERDRPTLTSRRLEDMLVYDRAASIV